MAWSWFEFFHPGKTPIESEPALITEKEFREATRLTAADVAPLLLRAIREMDQAGGHEARVSAARQAVARRLAKRVTTSSGAQASSAG